jgi:hypothetical protein
MDQFKRPEYERDGVYTNSFCSGVKKLQSLGVEAMRKNPAKPTPIVRNPAWRLYFGE